MYATYIQCRAVANPQTVASPVQIAGGLPAVQSGAVAKPQPVASPGRIVASPPGVQSGSCETAYQAIVNATQLRLAVRTPVASRPTSVPWGSSLAAKPMASAQVQAKPVTPPSPSVWSKPMATG